MIFDVFEGLLRWIFGEPSSTRSERKLKAHHLRRVAEIKAERGQF